MGRIYRFGKEGEDIAICEYLQHYFKF